MENSLNILASLSAALKWSKKAVQVAQFLDLPQDHTPRVSGHVLGPVRVVVRTHRVFTEEVFLVADKQNRQAILKLSEEVVVDLPHPEVEVLDRFFSCHVVDDYDSLRVRVKPVCDRLESLLTYRK